MPQNNDEDIIEQDDSPIIPPSGLFTTNEVRSCAELYRMVSENSLNTQPNYQRKEVWKNADQTRFLDSLSKRLPIPSLCISVSNEKYEVIDGQQRIATIVKFLSYTEDNPQTDWKLSLLDDVDPLLSGKKIADIKRDSLSLYNRIRNVMLPITLVYCDYGKKEHLEYIYKIFYRLNTSGLPLNNQEIRNCIFFGSFNNLLKELDNIQNWKYIFESTAQDPRLKGQERILLFFAFYDDLENYTGRLTTFLNQYMINHKNDNTINLASKKQLFEKTLEIASKIKYTKKSKVILDTVLYGISKNIDRLTALSPDELTEKYQVLIDSHELQDSISGAIWQKENTLTRCEKAKEVFSC